MEINETLRTPGAHVRVHVEKAYDFDARTGLWLRRQVEEDVEAHNIITNAGRVQLHTQVYGTTGLLANGFNWIALTNDATAPDPSDTALAGELSGNGLSRAHGTVTLPVGSGTMTTVAITFIYTGTSQTVQKTALFTQAAPGGVMNHEIAFTPRTLFTADAITLTFTVTTS